MVLSDHADASRFTLPAWKVGALVAFDTTSNALLTSRISRIQGKGIVILYFPHCFTLSSPIVIRASVVWSASSSPHFVALQCYISLVAKSHLRDFG